MGDAMRNRKNKIKRTTISSNDIYFQGNLAAENN